MEQPPKNENIETIPVVEFVYDREKDIKCILQKGPGGQFSSHPTKAYGELITQFGENPTVQQTSDFIETYFEQKEINPISFIEECKKESGEIMNNFKKVAEQVFGLQIPESTKAYLTINGRCPYDIEANMFYATISNPAKVISISMHELWHFYTWYAFGKEQKESGEFDRKKYGDIKEALTVLLNSESLNLLLEGERDNGYPQHKELRERIVKLWKQNPDIRFVWDEVWDNV